MSGNYITGLYADFAPIGTVTATSAQSDFPATKVSDFTTPNDPYKSTGAAGTAQRLVIDFGSTRTLQGLHLDHINVGSVKVQGNGTATWTSPSYSGTVAVSADPLDDRLKSFVDLRSTSWASVGYRYLSIQCNTSTTTFGGTVWIVGAVVPLITVTEWDTNTGPAVGRTRLRAVDPGAKPSGGAEPAGLGEPYARILLPAAALGSQMRATYDAVMANDEHQPMIFYRNLGATAESYCCHRIGTVRVDYSGMGYIQVDALLLEEYV